MEFNLKIGISSIIETGVTENDLAVRYASGDLEVYATPAMIALMENTSKSCVGLHLPSGYTTVGIQVDVKHIRACLPGTKVRCESTLTKVEGKKLFFDVVVYDNNGKIGEGTHIRYIVNEKEFMSKLQK